MQEFDDDIAKLKAALKGAPTADGPAKQAAFIVAEENFKALQERGELTRPKETPASRPTFLKGLKSMFAPISMKPLLLTTSSLVVIGVGVVLVQPNLQPDLGKASEQLVETVATDGIGETSDVPTSRLLDEELIVVIPSDDPVSADDIKEDGADQDIIDGQLIIVEAITEEPLQFSAPQSTAHRNAMKQARAGSVSGLAAGSPEIAILPAPTPADVIQQPGASSDRFTNEAPNPLKIAAEEPVSTFSTDVDTASYTWVRRSLQNGQLPDPAAVRIEEMVNYFPYAYAAPEGNAPFATTVSVSETPWNSDTQLVHIGIQGEMPAVEDRPPLNLVFLIDTSGSMNSPDKLPLLIQSFRLMLSELRPEDQVAIVAYAGSSGLVLEPTSASETAKINAALTNLSAGGSTAGAAGLQQAYQVAEQMSEEGEIGRVILATDGDFNVGQSSDEQLKTLIEAKRDSGTYLSVLGFGRGNLNDSLMQTLAQNGNGQAAYIDTLSEARKVLVDQLTGVLFPIAGDVKVQVEFNPAQIAEYRLIGYETRALKREDFNNDKVDAGDIGAGHTVTALYEVTPVGSPAVLNDPLRYGAAAASSDSDELGFLRLRYKEPGADQSQLIETVISPAALSTSTEAKFASAIAGFAQLLRGSNYLGDWNYSDAIALASDAKGDDRFGYRAEAITLMRLAESLAKSR
ncbi:MAG: VWA domain-containing protein [Pseudomonadota bacterium]